jgi:hypothetical protein
MNGAILRAQIELALNDLIDHEDGSRFQSLGVILATQKCDKLVAHEKKADLGLDGYAPILWTSHGAVAEHNSDFAST